MAGLTRLDPAIQPQDPERWDLLSWMAASEGGHDIRGFRINSTRFNMESRSDTNGGLCSDRCGFLLSPIHSKKWFTNPIMPTVVSYRQFPAERRRPSAPRDVFRATDSRQPLRLAKDMAAVFSAA